jgi:hypothetical protein
MAQNNSGRTYRSIKSKFIQILSESLGLLRSRNGVVFTVIFVILFLFAYLPWGSGTTQPKYYSLLPLYGLAISLVQVFVVMVAIKTFTGDHRSKIPEDSYSDGIKLHFFYILVGLLIFSVILSVLYVGIYLISGGITTLSGFSVIVSIVGVALVITGIFLGANTMFWPVFVLRNGEKPWSAFESSWNLSVESQILVIALFVALSLPHIALELFNPVLASNLQNRIFQVVDSIISAPIWVYSLAIISRGFDHLALDTSE